MNLTKRERAALHDIQTYPSGYCYKQASMRKLHEKGLVEPTPMRHAPIGPTVYWRLTAAGLAWLASDSASGERLP